MKTFTIKVTGSGTLQQLANALYNIADALENTHPDNVQPTYEDDILCAEVEIEE